MFFFPDLALSTLRGYKAYQFASGAAVWIWGGLVGESAGATNMTAGTEFAMPTPGYQTTTNGPCYVDMVDRFWQRTGNEAVLHEFYESMKRNTIFTMNLSARKMEPRGSSASPAAMWIRSVRVICLAITWNGSKAYYGLA